MSALVQFSHGNGFPASTYRSMFAALGPAFRVHAVERIGHDPAYPVSDGWPHLLRQLTDQLQRHQEAAILIGHSLGGLLSIAAAYAVPARVRAVLVLDAPVIDPWRARMLYLTKRSALINRVSPAGPTLRRRTSFASFEQASAHFRSKAAFAQFDDDVLRDYLGAPDNADEPLTLAFDARIEAEIYRTIPHHLHRLTRKPCPVPIGFLAGTRSYELRMAGIDATLRLVGENLSWVDGSHLFPMERPRVAAEAMAAMLERLL